MTSFRFMYPGFLWLLLALPLLALWWGRRGKAATILFSSTSIARQTGAPKKSAAGWFAMLLRLAALALFIFALARPQLGKQTQDISANGIDIMLAIDISGSMQALDFKLNGQPTSRVEVVKSVVKNFIDQRPNDRIGAVAFAGYSYLVSPLTMDHDWLEQRVDAISTDGVEDGTAIGSALATCTNHLRDQKGKSKVIILLTDGINNMGKISPLAAAELAKAMGVKVYTIGAGTRGEAMIPATDQFGRKVTVPMQVDIDEDTLQKIAQETGGKYYRATDTDSLKGIYAEINQMETTVHVTKKFENYRELFHWAILPALAVLLLEVAFSEALIRRLP
ncbi:MAG: VWA domain-containing protein [Verrucomicrobiales bacterium]|jgi:Ca-activated chloride channel family protein|nr:VWA domain-containing protein [Verrucomicrobiales bacterium]